MRQNTQRGQLCQMLQHVQRGQRCRDVQTGERDVAMSVSPLSSHPRRDKRGVWSLHAWGTLAQRLLHARQRSV